MRVPWASTVEAPRADPGGRGAGGWLGDADRGAGERAETVRAGGGAVIVALDTPGALRDYIRQQVEDFRRGGYELVTYGDMPEVLVPLATVDGVEAKFMNAAGSWKMLTIDAELLNGAGVPSGEWAAFLADAVRG